MWMPLLLRAAVQTPDACCPTAMLSAQPALCRHGVTDAMQAFAQRLSRSIVAASQRIRSTHPAGSGSA
jgi:hypothetical protein